MPQISLNIDQIIFEKITKIAKQKKTSVSDWVEDNIKKHWKMVIQMIFLNCSAPLTMILLLNQLK
jgi:hypothetical protein